MQSISLILLILIFVNTLAVKTNLLSVHLNAKISFIYYRSDKRASKKVPFLRSLSM